MQSSEMLVSIVQFVQVRLDTARAALLSLTMTHPDSPQLNSSSQPRFSAPPRS